MGLPHNRFQSERHEFAAIIVDSVRFWTAECAAPGGDIGHSKSVTLPRNGETGNCRALREQRMPDPSGATAKRSKFLRTSHLRQVTVREQRAASLNATLRGSDGRFSSFRMARHSTKWTPAVRFSQQKEPVTNLRFRAFGPLIFSSRCAYMPLRICSSTSLSVLMHSTVIPEKASRRDR